MTARPTGRVRERARGRRLLPLRRCPLWGSKYLQRCMLVACSAHCQRRHV